MDMFDRLPDEVVSHIISFLPTQYALQTSVLSKRWQFLWCYALNSLLFDDRSSVKPFESRFRRHVDMERVSSFHNFVDRILRLQKLPEIHKFVLVMRACISNSNQASWVQEVISQRRAKEIEIYFGCNVGTKRFSLQFPIQVFSSTVLQVLKLHGTWVLWVAGSNNPKDIFLPNLKVLHLSIDGLAKIWWLLRRLLHAAPRLEELNLGGFLNNSKGLYRIYSPSIKRLRIKFQSFGSLGKFIIDALNMEELIISDEYFPQYIVKARSCLFNAKLDIGRSYLRKEQGSHIHTSRLCKLLCRISNVKVLNLKAHTIDALSISCSYGHNLPCFPRLSRLQLCFVSYASWDVIPKFLASAPKLEFLILRKDFKRRDAKFGGDSSWFQPSEVPDCLSSYLHHVEIWDCESHQEEFDFISYLLKLGTVLQTFLVHLLPVNLREDLRFREKVMILPKGSEACQVKVLSHPQWPGHISPSPELHERWLPQLLCYEDLRLCTNYFSNTNLMARTKHFKVYRGKLLQCSPYGSHVKDVTVKKWVIKAERPYEEHKRISMRSFCVERMLLQHPTFSSHPHLMRVLGYCAEDNDERLGLVYDFKPLDNLENLLPKDCFNWLHRIKVALQLACILAYLHKKHEDLPSITPKIKAAHVMLDEDYSPVLSSFSPTADEVHPYREEVEYDFESRFYKRSKRGDEVSRYGVILLSLISRRVHQRPIDNRDRDILAGHYKLFQWATATYRDGNLTSAFDKSQVSLVHESLKADICYDSVDGLKLTRLAMRCVNTGPEYQPNMNGIVKYLFKLRVVRENWGVIDRDNRISNYLNAEFP